MAGRTRDGGGAQPRTQPGKWDNFSDMQLYAWSVGACELAFGHRLLGEEAEARHHEQQATEILSAAISRGLGDASHRWIEATPTIRWEHCDVCGVIRRADRTNSLCRGQARLREPESVQDDEAADMVCWCSGPDYCEEVLRGAPCRSTGRRN